jgi:PhzF family phenazine biosynthesis protein
MDGDGGRDGAERAGHGEPDGIGGRDRARTVPVGVRDAFAADPLAGAPVGVVPEAGGIEGEKARALARDLGGDGTAFVGPAEGSDADRRLWYVGDEAIGDGDAPPPIRAVVAAHARLLADDRIAPGDHAVETAAGPLDVAVTDDGVVWVDRPETSVETVDLDYDRTGEALGIDPAALRDVGSDLPAGVASVGRPFLIVPVNFLSHLSGAAPDGDAVAALADDHDAAGVYPVTFDALAADATLHARCFRPAPGGAFEDPVTGAGAGAAGAYLSSVEAFDGDPPDDIRVEQGHFVDRPGVVRVRVTDDGVRVGGRAVAALDGRIALPRDDGGDDIVIA